LKVLVRHIEELLLDHDCVVVPGLGGFVQNEISARYDPKTDIFYPEEKEIGFNARLTFNDGFLVQAYQETFGLSFEDANIQIHQGVQELLDKLSEGKYISLGKIGVMWKNSQGQLSFRSENRNLFFPEAYGLSSFSFPNIEKKQRKKTLIVYHSPCQEDEYINIRLRRNSFRNFIIGAAACLFMLFLSKPAGNLSETNNQEAFLMHDYISTLKNTVQDKIKDESTFSDPIPEIEQINRGKNSDEQVINESSYEKVDKEVKEVTPIKKKVDVSPDIEPYTHAYYIIIGSFPESRIAKAWIKSHHDHIFKKAGIVEKDGRARVFIRCFHDKTLAEAYLNQFRANHADYASAWLLCVKK
jgi:hypothetical protein